MRNQSDDLGGRGSDRLRRRGRLKGRLGNIGSLNKQAGHLLDEHLASRKHGNRHGGLGVPVQQQGSVLGSGPEELGGCINLLGILTKDHNGRGVPGCKIGKGPIRQDRAVPVSRPKCKAGARAGGRNRHRTRRSRGTRRRSSGRSSEGKG